MLTKPTPESRFAIVIPACDEEECIGRVLDELFEVIDPEKFVVAVRFAPTFFLRATVQAIRRMFAPS